MLLLAKASVELHGLALVEINPNETAQVWPTLQKHCKTVQALTLSPNPREDTKLQRSWAALTAPDLYRLGSRIGPVNCRALQQIMTRLQPNLVWAEDILTASLARRAAGNIPVVYSHYDWKWRIKRYRSGANAHHWRKRFDLWMSKRHEQALVRQVAGCVSASVTEADEIRRGGGRNVAYFPTLYTPIDPARQTAPGSPPRIVHLGGMQTTANMIGLQRFLQITWPELNRLLPAPPELWVIGNLESASPELLHSLQSAHAICTGFVENLLTVLRPCDLHIIPWEYNTGTRTRIPLALNYQQVLVSTRAAAACIDGLIDGENCVLVDDLHQLASSLAMLINDETTRSRIARAGRETFLNQFTQLAQQDRFNKYIRNISV